MIDRNAQVGWTDAQWNRVREEVLREWQRVRIAGSFLPIDGPLPPSTQVVPSEVVRDDGTIDDAATLRILELACTIELSRQQVAEEDLTTGLLLFRRAAGALARAEDAVIFRGQEVGGRPVAGRRLAVLEHSAEPREVVVGGKFPAVRLSGGSPAIASLRARVGAGPLSAAERSAADPSERGLVLGAENDVTGDFDDPTDLVESIVKGINQLENDGYGAPFVCVLSNDAFTAAHTPESPNLVVAADRIEPFLGRQLLRASALNEFGTAEAWGIVLSLAGDSIDLVCAVDATPQFALVDGEGHYVFRVFERFVLRVKDNSAIVRLHT